MCFKKLMIFIVTLMMIFVSFAKSVPCASEIIEEANLTVKEETAIYKNIGEILKNVHLDPVSKNYPINPIDGMIFAVISYLPVLNSIAGFSFCQGEEFDLHSKFTVERYATELTEILESKDDTLLNKKVIPEDVCLAKVYKRGNNEVYNRRVALLKSIAKNDRYKDISIGDWVVNFRPASNDDGYSQFAAITLTVENSEKVEKIVAFRGTDSTLTAWKENLRTFWKPKVPSQVQAVYYFADLLNKYSKYPEIMFSLTGHSKGGALAVYAFLKNATSDGRLSRIKKVYNFDGPGVNEEVLKKDRVKEKYADVYKFFYDKIIEKIEIFVPESTVVSTIMKNKDFRCYVVKTSTLETSETSKNFKIYKHISQHDPTLWLVNSNFTNRDVLKFKFSQRTVFSIAFEEAWFKIFEKLNVSAAKRVVKMLFKVYNEDELDIDLGLKYNLKRLFSKHVFNRPKMQIIKLFFSPSNIVTLSKEEAEDLEHVGKTILSELLISFWKYHKELNEDMKLSEKSLNSIKELVNSDFSKKRIMSTAFTLTMQEIGFFNFLKMIF